MSDRIERARQWFREAYDEAAAIMGAETIARVMAAFADSEVEKADAALDDARTALRQIHDDTESAHIREAARAALDRGQS